MTAAGITTGITTVTNADAGNRARRALEGARAITPMVVGVVPFGLAIGATIGESDISPAAGIASAPLVLAGAAQLSMIQMLDAGAAPLVVVLSALVINARLLLYSASIAPWFSGEPLGRRLALAIPVIDQLHFTCVPRFERGDLSPGERRWFYAGAAVWLAGAWVVTQWIALIAGARLPEWTGLHLAAPLALAGLLAKSVNGGASTTAAAVAATVALTGAGLPFQSATLLAAVTGIVAGTALTARTRPAVTRRTTISTGETTNAAPDRIDATAEIRA